MLPKVILYNALSVDGRNGGFAPDMGRFYGLAATWKEDATLVGSGTILAAPEGRMRDDPGAPPLAPPDRKDPRPLLAIADTGGRVRCWRSLIGFGYWKAGVAIVSRSTPAAYRKYLEGAGVERIEAGARKADLRKALDILRARFRVKTVRADTGGTLNGLLLRAGLVSEVSVLIHPVLVGDASKGLLVQGAILGKDKAPVPLRLLSCEPKDGFVWLRYAVGKSRVGIKGSQVRKGRNEHGEGRPRGLPGSDHDQSLKPRQLRRRC
jgi:2,5-diamino-6-(ribosylamino)-4(3H)-pyrimidinone 5'-phosphate reductase